MSARAQGRVHDEPAPSLSEGREGERAGADRPAGESDRAALSTLADPDVESAIAHYSWGDKAIEQRNRALASRLAREGKVAGEIARRIARGGERRTTGDDE